LTSVEAVPLVVHKCIKHVLIAGGIVGNNNRLDSSILGVAVERLEKQSADLRDCNLGGVGTDPSVPNFIFGAVRVALSRIFEV
jgi:hypothetical protein